MNTKHILEKIRLEGELYDLIAKSNGENVTVTYDGKEQTLSAALAAIFTSVTDLPTADGDQRRYQRADRRRSGDLRHPQGDRGLHRLPPGCLQCPHRSHR